MNCPRCTRTSSDKYMLWSVFIQNTGSARFDMQISLDDDAVVASPLRSSGWIHIGTLLVHYRTVH